ncbi:MAG: hypothetical protein EB069_07965, partial [Actinobacteria bacterium]|nr:hypothetical protein [Actinomycetota bacterium]
ALGFTPITVAPFSACAANPGLTSAMSINWFSQTMKRGKLRALGLAISKRLSCHRPFSSDGQAATTEANIATSTQSLTLSPASIESMQLWWETATRH